MRAGLSVDKINRNTKYKQICRLKYFLACNKWNIILSLSVFNIFHSIKIWSQRRYFWVGYSNGSMANIIYNKRREQQVTERGNCCQFKSFQTRWRSTGRQSVRQVKRWGRIQLVKPKVMLEEGGRESHCVQRRREHRFNCAICFTFDKKYNKSLNTVVGLGWSPHKETSDHCMHWPV